MYIYWLIISPILYRFYLFDLINKLLLTTEIIYFFDGKREMRKTGKKSAKQDEKS